MKEIVLEVKSRERVGKSVAKRLRRNGWIPAVVYGPKDKPMPLEVEKKKLRTILRAGLGENVIIHLKIDEDGKTQEKKVLMREIQTDPVTDDILHVDFQRILLTKKLTIHVPVHLVGEPEGVKEGGILQHTLRELEIQCLPADIPERIDVDASNLKIGDALHVRDIKLEKVDILTDLERTVVSVVPPTVFKEPEVVAEAKEPELVGEEKEEEEAKEEEKEEKAEKEAKPEVKEAKKEEKKKEGK